MKRRPIAGAALVAMAGLAALLGFDTGFHLPRARALPPPPPTAPVTAEQSRLSQPGANYVVRRLKPYHDPWGAARERWRDIANMPYTAFVKGKQKFSYANAQVTLSYDPNPPQPYFSGHIEARNLKPNFAYQLKLAGKPSEGQRGWGRYGDDLSNERLGKEGRWWYEEKTGDETNFPYPAAQLEELTQGHQIDRKGPYSYYGFLFLGDVVTDENGRASMNFTGSNSYHITWQEGQGSWPDVLAGTWNVGSLTGYGYGGRMATRSVKLWYQYEAYMPHPVRLPAGNYNCRFIMTEESFHGADGPGNASPGRWLSVLASEDFDANGNPDTDPSNDVTFTIR